MYSQRANNSSYLPIEFFGVKNGLSQGLVSGILQDKEGFIWFSTKDGLNRYDGYQMKIFRHDAKNPYSLTDNYTTDLIEDHQGRIWIGTFSNGICVYNKKKDKFYQIQLPQTSPDENKLVRHLKYKDGILCVTFNNLLFFDIQHVTDLELEQNKLNAVPVLFNFKRTLKRNYVNLSKTEELFAIRLWITNPNEYWITCQDSIYLFQLNTNRRIELAKSFSVSALHFDSHADIFYYTINKPTNSSLVHIIGGNKHVIYDLQSNKLIKEYVTPTKDAEIKNTDIKEFKGEKLNAFLNSKELYNNVQSASKFMLDTSSLDYYHNQIKDRNGIHWIGTSGHGAIKIDGRKLRFRNYLPAFAYEFKQDPQQNLLCTDKSTQTPFLYNLDKDLAQPLFRTQRVNPDWYLLDFNCDQAGTYYLLYKTPKNKCYLMSFNKSNNQAQIKEVDYLRSAFWNNILIDNQDELWLHYISSDARPVLIHFDKKTLLPQAKYFFPSEPEYREYPFVSSYTMDKNHNWWFATIQGLYHLDVGKNKWTQWKHRVGDSTSLSENLLFSLSTDPYEPDRFLWLGTSGNGLNKFDITTGKCKQYTMKEGLPNDVIYSIEHDNQGQLWMGTNKGISCFNVRKNTFRNYTSDDGLPGDEFNRYNSMRLINNELMFGGVEGLVLFDPKEVTQKGVAPPIALTELFILNKPFDFRQDTTIMQAPITYAKTITLPPDKGMFSIAYSALEYASTTSKKYKYYLEGFDKTWIDAGTKNEATYNNLTPGTYTFHVIGAGVDDVWNNEGASIKIIILPAWWQTWWFRIFVLLSIGGILYILYKYRLNQAIKLFNIRNRIAGDLHDEIGSTLSSISMSSVVIQEKLQNPSPEINSLLNHVIQNTNNMMESLSDIVWTINTKNETFENVIQRMRAFGAEMLEAKEIEIQFNVQKEIESLSLSMQQRKNIYLIFKEAINNAAKYSECSLVQVFIRLKERHVIELRIQDNGKGFDTSKETTEHLGGNGLFNMKKRSEELHGSFHITSTSQQGTLLIVQIPI